MRFTIATTITAKWSNKKKTQRNNYKHVNLKRNPIKIGILFDIECENIAF